MVHKIKSYYFKDKDGIELTLCYGREISAITGEVCTASNAQRWVMYGKRIPMPVRSGTWFQGLDTNSMIEYLESNGYTLEAYVNLGTGIMHKCAEDKPASINMINIERHIRRAYNGNNKGALVLLYRDITSLTFEESKEAVNAIIDNSL